MKTIKLIVPLLFSALICANMLSAQKEQEIIIIEKTIDADGNEISKHITRTKGDYSEAEIQKLIDEATSSGSIKMGRYPMDMQDFGQKFFRNSDSDGKPRLGITTNDQDNAVKIVSVGAGSSAEKAELKKGDIIISIDDVAISTTQDIKDILDKKKTDDVVCVQIYRDGQTYQKNVTLQSSESNLFFEPFNRFDNLEESFEGFEGFDIQDLMDRMQGQMRMFMDTSLLHGEIPFGMRLFPQEDLTDRGSKSDKASLGAFVEDSSEGLKIVELVANGSAKYGGLIPNDIITKVDNTTIENYDDLSRLMSDKKVGDELSIEVLRKNTIKKIKIKLK